MAKWYTNDDSSSLEGWVPNSAPAGADEVRQPTADEIAAKKTADEAWFAARVAERMARARGYAATLDKGIAKIAAIVDDRSAGWNARAIKAFKDFEWEARHLAPKSITPEEPEYEALNAATRTKRAETLELLRPWFISACKHR